MAGPLVTFGHGIVEGLLGPGPWPSGPAAFLGGTASRAPSPSAGPWVLTVDGLGDDRRGAGGRAASRRGRRRVAASPGPVSGGALASLANPYWYLWWATVGLARWRCRSVGRCWDRRVLHGAHRRPTCLADGPGRSRSAKGRRLMTPKVYRGLIGGLGALSALLLRPLSHLWDSKVFIRRAPIKPHRKRIGMAWPAGLRLGARSSCAASLPSTNSSSSACSQDAARARSPALVAVRVAGGCGTMCARNCSGRAAERRGAAGMQTREEGATPWPGCDRVGAAARSGLLAGAPKHFEAGDQRYGRRPPHQSRPGAA